MSKYICDICSKSVARRKIKFHSGATIKRAIGAGFNPWKTPGFDMSLSESLSRAFGRTGEETYTTWRQQAMTDTTDWGLCSTCTEAFARAYGAGGSKPSINEMVTLSDIDGLTGGSTPIVAIPDPTARYQPLDGGPIELLLRSPLSAASFVRYREEPSSKIFTRFIVHEDAQHVRALPKEVPIQGRVLFTVRQGVGVTIVLLRIAGQIYETSWNFHNRAAHTCFYDLCWQDKLLVSFYVDQRNPEHTVWTPNLIRPQLKVIVKLLEAMEPWEMAAFDRAREELYREFPTPQTLWSSTET